MPASDRARRRPAPRRALALAAALTLAPAALGHGFLVLGTLTLQPDPPAANSPVTITLHMQDTSGTPVQDATVLADIGPAGSDDAPTTIHFSELKGDAGSYRGSFTAPTADAYTLTVRDQTYRREEARANLTFQVGSGANGEIPFVLPPTATGPRSLGTWLLWLVGVPLAAGVLVTVLVMRGGASRPAPAGRADARPRDRSAPAATPKSTTPKGTTTEGTTTEGTTTQSPTAKGTTTHSSTAKGTTTQSPTPEDPTPANETAKREAEGDGPD